MAVLTLRSCRQMIDRFAGSSHIVMTTVTGTLYLEMVHRGGGFPRTGAMAVLADIGAIDMIQAFAGRTDPIMTTVTALGRSRMVKACRQPGRDDMAIVTGFFTGNVG